MINLKLRSFFVAVFFLISSGTVFAKDFVLFSKTTKVSIVYDKQGPPLDSISAFLLQQDIGKVTGYLPRVTNDLSNANGNLIIIGNINSVLIKEISGGQTGFLQRLQGQWECYGLKLLTKPLKNVGQALIIAGSDARGAAYGVFNISEKIGVSPWYWWADVPVAKKQQLKISITDHISQPPSVKYRGIFLNDEDWGLQPWAAKTLEPEIGDIGPKTYAKIFELLLRLKANLIWPAMHPSTKAFYSYPGNKKVAADYNIVVGSSHAEPMLRNNVGEWDEKTMGNFNYITNKDRVYNYWEQRVKESSTNDAIYTMGMRGVHDSGIEGVRTVKEAVPLIERIIDDQRGLLKKYVSENIASVPQVFTAYKEVLEIYDSNLKLPDDVTIVWPDDNYGYIQRLSNEQEKSRPGGSGIYYHASYWGRPHDYLWLSTTNPALIREEMMKAFDNGTDRLWVLNVGDLKPLEYNIQLFMDMAYHAAPFKNSSYLNTHRIDWATRIFGQNAAAAIGNIWRNYYQLAFERRPEFMGWSQTEPTTQTKYSDYNHFYYGDEAQRRIDAYEMLEKQVKTLKKLIVPSQQDAYYELVYYPVVSASWMNKKFLFRDKSVLYAQQNRASASDYAQQAKLAYDSIRMETEYFNKQLADGKWMNIMSMTPRNLPVYQEPVIQTGNIDRTESWNIAPEGWISKSLSGETRALPSFQYLSNKKYFVDIFLSDDKVINWKASSPQKWIKISRESGTLSPLPGKKEYRIWISIDWARAPKHENFAGTVSISSGDKVYNADVAAIHSSDPALVNFKGFIEDNAYLSISAVNYSRSTASQGKWEIVDGLSPAGAALSASWSDNPQNPSVVEYDFYTFTGGTPVFNIYTLPTLPLNNMHSMRYAVSVDNDPVKEIDFKTVGRTEEWKQNVLSNSAVRQFTSQPLEKGKHTLKIYPRDPGIIFQNITADFGGLKKAYGTIPETK